jgi:Flp pilus assembly pilin Flp
MISYLAGLRARLMVVLVGEEGQGLAEYALILAFIAVVAIAALTFLGSDISSLLSKVANEL